MKLTPGPHPLCFRRLNSSGVRSAYRSAALQLPEHEAQHVQGGRLNAPLLDPALPTAESAIADLSSSLDDD